MGEGGAAKPSHTLLDIVLAWHQEGLVAEFQHAVGCVNADLTNQFISNSVLHSPFVPLRVNPRNIVMQERARVQPGGGVEFYLKPRMTSHLSFGVRASTDDALSPGEGGPV